MTVIPNRSGKTSSGISNLVPAFLRDERVLSVIFQLVFAVLLVYALSALWGSILGSLSAKNLTPNMNFLGNRAGFDIGERPEWYSSNSSYGDAFRVGLTNTLRIISVGLVLTTALGVLAGIFLLSSNWLLRNLTRGIVELLRNTPVLVQLIFWYAIVIASLPEFRTPLTLPPEGRYIIPVHWVIEAAILLFVWFSYLRREKAGAPNRRFWLSGLWAAIIAIEIGFAMLSSSYGAASPGNSIFLLYAGVSIVAIIISARFVTGAWRWTALGLLVGQLIGGCVFYFGIMPSGGIPFEIFPTLFISRRGVAFPEIRATARFADWLAFIAVGAALAVVAWVYFGRVTEQTGRPYPRTSYAIGAILLFAIIGWVIVGSEPTPATFPVTQDGQTTYLTVDEAKAAGLYTLTEEEVYSPYPILYIPPVQRVNNAGIVSGYVSGSQVTPEYIALLVGLVVYTAAFIAEIVRAGILAVPKGQIEASRALGFTTTQTLSMIILPQAMRVIIPPLASQYLNLAKNSSLAIAIAFADIFQVSVTIMNQSGQSVSGITMIMLTYLSISLIIASFTNLANRRFQLVTR
ncbi:MAG: ABC transporter permease subunit [Anaerolineae bacterium]